MMPTRSEVEPQRMDMTISGAKQVVLLKQSTILVNKGVAERVAYCGRDTWQKGGAILVMPTRGEVEPQRMDVTISGAKQVVLLKQSTIFVNKGVAEWVAYCRRDVWQKGGAILMMPTCSEVEPQRMDMTISGAKQVVLLDYCRGSRYRSNHTRLLRI